MRLYYSILATYKKDIRKHLNSSYPYFESSILKGEKMFQENVLDFNSWMLEYV